VTLKTGLRDIQGHWKWRRLIDHDWLSIGQSLYVWLYLVPFSSYLALNNIVTLKLGLEVAQGHWNFFYSKALCGFLFAFHSNYGHILYHFRNKARYWSKISIFQIPCIWHRVRGEYWHTVLYEKKTRMVWLTDGEKVEDTFSCFDRIPTGVPQTYRRTSCDVIVRAMHRIAR